jgi:NADPH-dependent 2,4-dienoyl-CoA reductase/sulfur reductase-like enzyme/rhodanese-related sulfurtransferase
LEGQRLIVVGGVAGGASCAARARRLCEKCEILLFDRGPYVSFANCGLPYYVGNVIVEERKLLVATPHLFKERFNIEVRTKSEVTAIDREKKVVYVKDGRTGETYTQAYDSLVLSTGAQAVRPPLPGIDLPQIFELRTIPDSRKIREAIGYASSALVVGGGFIGLEMAENLARRGLSVNVVELSSQVLPPLDPEMATFAAEHLKSHGIRLVLNNGVARFDLEGNNRILATLNSGEQIQSDIVVLAIGVRPETTLARQADLRLGRHGGIQVDDSMRTSDQNIWAVGDVIEVRDIVTGEWELMPLAGPANRQGRIAAESIIRCHQGREARPQTFRGVQGTAVCGIFDLTVAMTGASEKKLKRAGFKNVEKVYLHPGHHVAYYPGAKSIHMKLLFDASSGRVLGAQAIGEAGVERRIDVISMAIQNNATVFELEEAELCYAPQFGAAKDPVNVAGMIAANCVRGDLELADWNDVDRADVQVVDVRTPAEYDKGHMPQAVNIPIDEMRDRLDELPADKEIWLVCEVGQRAYYATRLLLQSGFQVKNLSGGMRTYSTIHNR